MVLKLSPGDSRARRAARLAWTPVSAYGAFSSSLRVLSRSAGSVVRCGGTFTLPDRDFSSRVSSASSSAGRSSAEEMKEPCGRVFGLGKGFSKRVRIWHCLVGRSYPLCSVERRARRDEACSPLPRSLGSMVERDCVLTLSSKKAEGDKGGPPHPSSFDR